MYPSRHAGPANTIFYNIEHAGKHSLKVNCNNYPYTTNSFILPPLFITKYPEGEDPTTLKPEPRANPALTQKEQKKFDGIVSGQGGEQTEYKVFNLFTKLLEKQQDHPMLVLRDFELNTKGKTNLKRRILISEYPQLYNIDMRGEQDYIVLLKDLGLVAVEVKRKLTADALQKAKDQLDRAEPFLNDITSAVAPMSHCLPIVKLIVYEMDDPLRPGELSIPGYHFFNCNGDSISFKDKWEDLKQELNLKIPTNPPNLHEFKCLARLLVGLWAMKSLNRQPYFDVNDASLPHLTTQVNINVDHAHLSSDTTKAKVTKDPPVTNVEYNQQGTVFRDAKEIQLMYLTPEQKNIYDNVQRGLIIGAAGTGKTLLMLFKVIELAKSPHDNNKVIIIAPHPHTIRCKNILQANGVMTVESDIIPSTTIPNDVLIMNMSETFENKFQSVIDALSSYHLFIDDFQSVVTRTNNVDNLSLLDKAYDTASQNNHYFWCMVDSVQREQGKGIHKNLFTHVGDGANDNEAISDYCFDNMVHNMKEIQNTILNFWNENQSVLNLPDVDMLSLDGSPSSLPTFTNDEDITIAKPENELQNFLSVTKAKDNRLFSYVREDTIEYKKVPKYFLTNILRNTKEISNAVLRLRKENQMIFKIPCVDTYSSHKMTSTLPTFHKLTYNNNNEDRDDFMLERLEVELRNFINAMSSIPLNDIALLFDLMLPYSLKDRTKTMLRQMFNIIPMTIEDQLKSCTPTIILDDVKNAVSGEWPVVILFLNYSRLGSAYTAFSRARTQLIVITRCMFDEPAFHTDVQHVECSWRKDNIEFVQL